MPLPFSSADSIRLAACPTCCAYRNEPCRFARCEDPEGNRALRRQSHPARTILARKIFQENSPTSLDIKGFRL